MYSYQFKIDPILSHWLAIVQAMHPYQVKIVLRMSLVRLGIEFWELELNSNSIYKYRGKKLCLDVEFWNWKILYFNSKKLLEV
jgi:hypothetical protein